MASSTSLASLAAATSQAACTSSSSDGPFTLDGGADGAGNSTTGPGKPPATTTPDGSPPSTGTDAATTPPSTSSSSTYGDVHEGQYDLGPVELWLALRGWAFVNLYGFTQLPNLDGELTFGAALKF